MSNLDVATEYIEYLWNQGRTDLADKYLAEDLIQHNANLADGRTALVTFIEGARQQMPGMKFVIRRSAADGDLVFLHSQFIPAPGASGLAVIDVFRIADGVIAEHWDVNEAVPESTVSGHDFV